MIIGRWVQYLHGRLYKLYEQKKWWASLGDGLFPGRVRSIGMAGFLQNDDISTEGQPTSTLCMYKCIPNFIIYIYTYIHVYRLYSTSRLLRFTVFIPHLQMVIPPWSLFWSLFWSCCASLHPLCSFSW